MGVISELIIASASDASLVAESLSPCENWQGFVWKGLDHIKLATLWCIIAGEELEVDHVVERSEQIEMTNSASEEGPWVFVIPTELRNILAELAREDDEKIQAVARDWATTEELEEWEFSDVTGMLQETIDLADSARIVEKDLLLWICL